MQAVFDRNLVTDKRFSENESPLGKRIGIFGKLFGCWHKRLTRPVTRDRVTFRSCLECGARRNFDMERFKTTGPFYFPPTVKAEPFRQVT